MPQDQTAEERKRAWYREYRRKRRAAGIDGMGNDEVVIEVHMNRSPWIEVDGVLSREVRGI
jgi:hypothetical protein